MTEIRCVIMQLDRSLKSFTLRVVWWERLIPHKQTTIRLFYFVLFWHFLSRDVLTPPVDTNATLANLSYVQVELGKNRFFLHLVNSLLPSF